MGSIRGKVLVGILGDELADSTTDLRLLVVSHRAIAGAAGARVVQYGILGVAVGMAIQLQGVHFQWVMPTAIFANNDYAAVIAMSEVQQMGLAIPDDISIVGYDNSYLARLGYIGLTTVDNNYVEMGRLAVLRLIERIDAPNASRTITLLDPSLASRSTVSRLD
jgi:hypothetical protein